MSKTKLQRLERMKNLIEGQQEPKNKELLDYAREHHPYYHDIMMLPFILEEIEKLKQKE